MSVEVEKKKRDKILWRVVFVLFGFVFLLICIVAMSPDEVEPVVKLTKNEIHQKNIEKLFSPWDGSHIKLEAKIKESLNDPESYENIETKYWDMDSVIVIKTIFTAKNEYGGVEKYSIRAESDINGNIIKME